MILAAKRVSLTDTWEITYRILNIKYVMIWWFFHIENSQCILYPSSYPVSAHLLYYEACFPFLQRGNISMCHIQMVSIRRNLIKQLGLYYVFNNNMQDHLSNASCQNIIEDKITGILTSTVYNTCLP